MVCKVVCECRPIKSPDIIYHVIQILHNFIPKVCLELHASAFWCIYALRMKYCWSKDTHYIQVFLVVLQDTCHGVYSHPPTRHTVTHACEHKRKAHCRAGGSVMDSPEHVCVVANALRQGTWLTTVPEGASASAASRCSQLLAATNLLSEKRKQHPTHSYPMNVIVNYGDFSNHLHASVHLVELELNCHPPPWSQGFKWVLCNQTWYQVWC